MSRSLQSEVGKCCTNDVLEFVQKRVGIRRISFRGL